MFRRPNLWHASRHVQRFLVDHDQRPWKATRDGVLFSIFRPILRHLRTVLQWRSPDDLYVIANSTSADSTRTQTIALSAHSHCPPKIPTLASDRCKRAILVRS